MIEPGLIAELLTTYQIPAVFAGAFFFGESVIITSVYLAAQFNWSLVMVVSAVFAGTVISDLLWFVAGNLLRSRLEQTLWLKKQREQASQLLAALTGTRPFIALLFIKFLYGSRIAMILYLAARQVTLWQFIVFNSLGTLLWMAVIIPLGYLAGRGADSAMPLLNRIELAVLVLIVSAVLFRLFSLWLTKKIADRK